MAEEHEDIIEPSGTSRRDFLRKSAVVGGMVWAAPTVMSLGPSAFAAEGGSPGGQGFPCGVAGTLYKFKWNAPSVQFPMGNFECSWGSGNQCDKPADWDNATCVELVDTGSGYFDSAKVEGNLIVVDDTDLKNVTITLPVGCTYTFYEAKAGRADDGGCIDKDNLDEATGEFTFTTNNQFTVDSTDKDLSNIGVIFCCEPVPV